MTLSKSCNNPINPTIIRRRILILSLEFNYSSFSGNGVLSRSIGSSLARRDDCTVRVICAKPHPATPDISNDIDMTIIDNVDICPVELPRQCKWKRLDKEGPWYEFATNACNFVNNVKDYQPTDVIAVDWHGMLAWRAICDRLLAEFHTTNGNDSVTSSSSWHPTNVKVCYYNFRVYSNSDYADDKSFYKEKEQLSCQMSNVVICLSEHDRYLLQMIDDDDNESLSKQKIHILFPPLRGDVYNLAMNQSNISSSLPHEVKSVIEKVSTVETKYTNKRMLITCMARLSPEKSPHHFVTLLQKLGGVEFLRKYSMVPILCGSKSVDEYASKVINDFKALCSAGGQTWPCIVIIRHLCPAELAAVFSSTVINVHVSCLYCVSFFIEMFLCLKLTLLP